MPRIRATTMLAEASSAGASVPTRRLPIYKPAIGERLAGLLANGVPLDKACKQVRIAKTTAYDWLATSEEWAALHARAREMLAHKYAACAFR